MLSKSIRQFICATILLFQISPLLAAQANTESKPTDKSVLSDTLKTGVMPQIEVIGVQDRFVRIPGSADLINFQKIRAISPLSGNEVIRSISGINVVDEEGLGLRANIGIRGLDPDRSRTVLMLEDGIPVALAPYGEPEMYYTPSIDRMVGIEVLKGSGSILFGPQTFGGVINYLSANPPAVPTATAHIRGGNGGLFTGKFGYGTTFGNTGVQATYVRKQGENVGLIDYGIHDFNTKIRLALAENSILGFKVGFYDEQSNSTYVGLTQPMYDSGNYDFTQLSPNDNLSIRRYNASVTHDHYFSESVRLKTTAFGYTTTRNWARQDFDNSPVDGRDYDRIVGDSGTPFGAIYFRNSTGNRDRQFEVLGVEPRLSVNFEAGSLKNELDFGFRYLYERAFEQFVSGTPTRPTSGTLRDDEIRTGKAFSTFAQNRIFVTDAFTVTPGIRFENFDYSRDIFRSGGVESSVNSGSSITEIIPGIGFNYKITETSSVFAGLHRGFGPPRTKDAITGSGVAEDLDAERSWNYEIGTRTFFNPAVALDVAVFYMDFENQIIPVSESSGGLGSGLSGLINGGETRHTGVESTLDVNIGMLLDVKTGIQFRTSATFANSEFSNDRFVSVGGNTVNVKGNALPYAPEMMINSKFDVSLTAGLDFGLELIHVAQQYTDLVNSDAGSNNGRSGLIPSYTVLNAMVGYTIPGFESASLNVAVKNLTDERYIASRRPQGIRLGLSRFISAGFDVQF
ncbi:MAG TPA: Fe3+-dicitrate receptor [Bacteroidetes bacterium]|nr:Fe3+-dicitrate receptor [Bacteroidota bacterium]